MMRHTGFPRLYLAVTALALAVLPAAGRGAPARTKIAFALDTSAEGRSSRIYVANSDGTDPHPVSPGTGRERAPAFSPDGRTLAYQSSSDPGIDTIYVQPVAGGSARPLAIGASPQWSRDGKLILFARRQLNQWGLFAIRADGTQRDEGLKPIAAGQIGRWSPDGQQLAAVVPAIVEGRDRWQVQILPVSGGTTAGEPRARLTLPESWGQVVSLAWSPDGDQLLLSTARQPRYEMYLLDLKSPAPRQIPQAEAGRDVSMNAAYGSWSPDGKQILFRCAAEDSAAAETALSRLCIMNADGTGARTLWQPPSRGLRVQGTDWQHPPRAVEAAQPPKNPVVAAPAPMPPAPVQPAPVQPAPVQPQRVPGPPVKRYGAKVFTVPQPRSPVSVSLGRAGAGDFTVTATVLPLKSWTPRRQGIGISLDLDDGSLYRGTVIYNGGPWVTLQGRPRGAKVRLIDGKQLDPTTAGFREGFKLTLRREGRNLILAIDDQDVLTKPVLTSGVKALSLTLENFDPGSARFNLGSVYYRAWQG